MYDPTLLDKLATQLEAQLNTAIATQNFVETARYARTLEQLKTWRMAGQVDALPPGVTKTLWCYWEAVDNPRHGWTFCEYLTTTTGQPAEQLTDGFPELMPSQR